MACNVEKRVYRDGSPIGEREALFCEDLTRHCDWKPTNQEEDDDTMNPTYEDHFR
jgi:hypothetical protein